MPITPFHLGPGLLAKAVFPQQISLSVFAFSQVVMDIEVVGRFLLNMPTLHGFSNSLLGATLLFLPSLLLGRFLSLYFLRWWNRQLSPQQAHFLAVIPVISWSAAVAGAGFGVYSHWFLDAIMHADAQVFWPWATDNPFLGWLSIEQLQLFCLLSGGLGLLIWGLQWLLVRQQ